MHDLDRKEMDTCFTGALGMPAKGQEKTLARNWHWAKCGASASAIGFTCINAIAWMDLLYS